MPLITKPLNPYVTEKFSSKKKLNPEGLEILSTRESLRTGNVSTKDDESGSLESVATTTEDAIRFKHKTQLQLSGLHLSRIPVPDFGDSRFRLPGNGYGLMHLRTLDLSNNPQLGPELSQLPAGFLPPNLEELSVVGCGMIALPMDVATLPRLRKLSAGANRISDPTWALVSASLVHVGLSYNCITDAALLCDEVLQAAAVTGGGRSPPPNGDPFFGTESSALSASSSAVFHPQPLGRSGSQKSNVGGNPTAAGPSLRTQISLASSVRSAATDASSTDRQAPPLPPPLPPPPPAWQLISLDLAHNNITSLNSIVKFVFSKTLSTSKASASAEATMNDEEDRASAVRTFTRAHVAASSVALVTGNNATGKVTPLTQAHSLPSAKASMVLTAEPSLASSRGASIGAAAAAAAAVDRGDTGKSSAGLKGGKSAGGEMATVATVATVRRFPKLSVLHLAGNSFCLASGYVDRAKSVLAAPPGTRRRNNSTASGSAGDPATEGIVYLDGKKLEWFRLLTPSAAASAPMNRPSEIPSKPLTAATLPLGGLAAAGASRSSRPPTADDTGVAAATAAVTAAAESASLPEAAAPAPEDLDPPPPTDAQLVLNLGPLAISENPFRDIESRWQAQVAEAERAGAVVPPELEMPSSPMQPVTYYYEFEDIKGGTFRSEPLVIDPPQPPDVATMFDPKLKAAAAAKKPDKPEKDKDKGKPETPAKGGRGQHAAGAQDTATTSAPLPQQGELIYGMPIHSAWIRERDWIRSGFKIRLFKVIATAIARPPPVLTPEEEAALAAAKSKNKNKKEEPPPIEYDITTETIRFGETRVMNSLRALLDGQTPVAAESVTFAPPPELWDDRGLRMALKDERHSRQVIATLTVRAALFEPPAEDDEEGERRVGV